MYSLSAEPSGDLSEKWNLEGVGRTRQSRQLWFWLGLWRSQNVLLILAIEVPSEERLDRRGSQVSESDFLQLVEEGGRGLRQKRLNALFEVDIAVADLQRSSSFDERMENLGGNIGTNVFGASLEVVYFLAERKVLPT